MVFIRNTTTRHQLFSIKAIAKWMFPVGFNDVLLVPIRHITSHQ